MNFDGVDSFDQLFEAIYKGDQSAKDLSFKVLQIVHTWDDLIDKDKPVDDEDIHKAFINALFGCQQYRIWHDAGLQYHMMNVYLRWRDATTIEADKNSTDDDLLKCYMLRAGFYDLFVLIAFHMFGMEWAAEIGPLVRKYYGETPKDYLEEMRNE